MPSSSMRHRVELPLDLYQALNQAAADAAMPTSALTTMWLLHMLQERRPDLHVRDPYRCGIEQYERRPRRPEEWPDDQSFADRARSIDAWDDDESGGTAPPLEGGILPLVDRPPTQS